MNGDHRGRELRAGRSAQRAAPESTCGEILAFSIEDLAQATSFSRSMLYLEVAEGRLPARKLNNRTVVLRRDALAWLDNLPYFSSGRAEGNRRQTG